MYISIDGKVNILKSLIYISAAISNLRAAVALSLGQFLKKNFIPSYSVTYVMKLSKSSVNV